ARDVWNEPGYRPYRIFFHISPLKSWLHWSWAPGYKRVRVKSWKRPWEDEFVAGMLQYSFNQVVPQDLYKSQNPIRNANGTHHDRYTGSSLRTTQAIGILTSEPDQAVRSTI